jgi:hypothetical protein
MLRLFRKQRKELTAQLASRLSEFHADDQRMIETSLESWICRRVHFAEADEALGPPATASPCKVEAAAAVLGVYAAVFKPSEAELSALVKTLESSVAALR